MCVILAFQFCRRQLPDSVALSAAAVSIGVQKALDQADHAGDGMRRCGARGYVAGLDKSS
jgi:hypothetical protein